MSNHLAWHETLEIHELVAFQSIGLQKLKKSLPEVTDPELRRLYQKAIQGTTRNLRDLLVFFPEMPPFKDREDLDEMRSDSEEEEDREDPMTGFFAGELLGLAKTTVRNYGIAITETATPSVRKVLKRQLSECIDSHEEVFRFMHQRSFYPAYNLETLLKNDMRLAQRALSGRED
ncbi:spore coat protein F [Evansella vedderi]|uniref:Spore coat protein F n=1 Tax=Evansella vedderi TaxID=38282 RepID=A0ABT9ZQL4_9BACI|nr:spore coat protein [Evansella vedderi]MDQ0253532.1 spore coat protein F [Evansella vedderi]